MIRVQPSLAIALVVSLTSFAPAAAAGPRDGASGDPPPAPAAGEAKRGTAFVPIDDPRLRLAPYVWKRTGSGSAARAEATLPGAYFRVTFRGSRAVRLVVDGAANRGCPPAAIPIVDSSIDRGAFKSTPLPGGDALYPLPLGGDLDGGSEHRLEVFFRSACLGPDRWTASTVHLRVAGLELDEGASLLPTPVAPRIAIGYGDSITEGVCSEGGCPFYSDLSKNNARVTWFPLVAGALDCEYGQLGSGGQGMMRPMALPPLGRTWDRYDAETSRLVDGLLDPQPDHVFCAMGTNDFEGEGAARRFLPITGAYIDWLTAMRRACPRARIFCVVPPLGWHAGEIAKAVATRRAAGDSRVHLLDTAPLKDLFNPQRDTQLAFDGVHPSLLGNAVLGSWIAVQVQKVLDREEGPPAK